MKDRAKSATPRRGASRLQPVEQKAEKVRKPRFTGLRHIPWPLLLVVVIVSGFIYGSVSLPSVFVKYLDKPVQHVVVTGQIGNINVSELKQAVLHLGEKGFVSTDMDALRERAEQFGWARAVKVQRFWPYGIELNVQEHVPVARWGEDSLLSSDGEVFHVPDTEPFKALPNLMGIEGQELEMMATYSDLSRLLAPIGLTIESLTRSSRGAWQLVCRNQLKLNLGRDQVSQKVSKFVSVYRLALYKNIEQIEQVDLRYTNGLAVAWKSQEQQI